MSENKIEIIDETVGGEHHLFTREAEEPFLPQFNECMNRAVGLQCAKQWQKTYFEGEIWPFLQKHLKDMELSHLLEKYNQHVDTKEESSDGTEEEVIKEVEVVDDVADEVVVDDERKMKFLLAVFSECETVGRNLRALRVWKEAAKVWRKEVEAQKKGTIRVLWVCKS